MENIYLLQRYCIKSKTGIIRHPRTSIVCSTIGSYHTLESTIAVMHEFVANDNNRCTYCFYILEYNLKPEDIEIVIERCYTKDGKLYDHYFKTSNNLFRGRIPKDIRFKVGDIVEVLKYDSIDIEIITSTPATKEVFRQRCKGAEWYAYCFERTDDVYTTHSLVDLREDYHPHSHPYPITVFPLSRPISAKHRREFTALLPEYFGKEEL